MESTSLQRGKFISFEGSEGCGKSTQIRRFVEWLRAAGREVLLTREPGGTAVGEKVRHLLQHDPEAEAMTPEAELLLFAASRAQLVREVVLPALEAGAWVVADRFLDSTTVYQGVARGLDPEAVRRVNAFAVGPAVPDLTFLLDLDSAVGHARAVASSGGRQDRIEAQPPAFFEAVRRGYLDLAAAEPDRIAVIDASATVDEVFAALVDAFEKRLGVLPSPAPAP
jgi:dTMP kinase